MKPLNLLSLFAGIGGFELGLERSGAFKTVAQCEIDPFCRRVLAKHWPDVPRYEDVRTLTAARLAADGIAVDAICGGFPCQDISYAGKGAGIAEGTRSGLWYEYARLIGELRPRVVVVENVGALLSRGMDAVLGTLSSLGYDAEWENIPAWHVGLPHSRERIWIIAYPAKEFNAGKLLGWHYPKGDEARKAATSLLPPYHDGMGHGRDSYTLRDGDGFPAFLDRLNQCGNAVVPQIPELIGRAIGRALASADEVAA
jgi:DNA (cytosine-5)-methyltransferase 1